MLQSLRSMCEENKYIQEVVTFIILNWYYMVDIKAITQTIDTYLSKINKHSIGPVEASRELNKAGLLNDNTDRPGKPLRDLLRKGLLPNAYQLAGKGTEWIIPSSKSNSAIGIQPSISNLPPRKQVVIAPPFSSATALSELTNTLMNENCFWRAGEIDSLVPNKPGIYCIRIANPDTLPDAYASVLAKRGHNIVYIGIASRSLEVRFLRQELRAKGHGTFFRSIGAILGHKPLNGSLKNKTNKQNYKFPPESEKAIIKWINANLIVNWIEHNGNIESIEAQLIAQHLPLVNIDKNPAALNILSKARAECVKIARQ